VGDVSPSLPPDLCRDDNDDGDVLICDFRTMDPMWMAEYEDPEVVKYRMSLRPATLDVPQAATSVT
jgi:hypothetical protein